MKVGTMKAGRAEPQTYDCGSVLPYPPNAITVKYFIATDKSKTARERLGDVSLYPDLLPLSVVPKQAVMALTICCSVYCYCILSKYWE